MAGKMKADKIGAVLLAAGLSRRAGPVNKLLTSIDGTAIVRRSLSQLVASKCDPIIVVTGHQAEKIENALVKEPVTFVYNHAYPEGMAASIRSGIAALPSDVDAGFIVLGDMPHIRVETYKALIGAFDPNLGHEICVPIFKGKYGNPVLFGRRFFNELAAQQGDKGGKSVLKKRHEFVIEVDVDDPGIQLDYDTVQGLE